MNIYDKQISIFENFIEEAKDRLHLLTKTDVIVFEPTAIVFLNKFKFINDGLSAMPRLSLLGTIEGPVEFNIMSHIMQNYLEICDIIKNYTQMYVHVVGFESKLLDVDQASGDSLEVARELEELINEESINGYSKLILETESSQIFLEVHYFGSDRKNIVNMHYRIVHVGSDEPTYVPYIIEKELFIQDFIYQVANKIPTHLKL